MFSGNNSSFSGVILVKKGMVKLIERGATLVNVVKEGTTTLTWSEFAKTTNISQRYVQGGNDSVQANNGKLVLDLCDGSVQCVSNSITAEVHRNRGIRADGNPSAVWESGRADEKPRKLRKYHPEKRFFLFHSGNILIFIKF